mgnify:FL=1
MLGQSDLRNFLRKNSIIPALRSSKDVDAALKIAPKCVFVLESSIESLRSVVDGLKKRGHIVFVHADLVEGLKTDPSGIRFLVREVNPYGLISTHKSVIENARDLHLLTILRIFLLDSQAFKKGKQLAYNVNPDFVEVLPGISMISVDDVILKEIPPPLIAGGLIKTMEQVNKILSRGVLAVSTSERTLWEQ